MRIKTVVASIVLLMASILPAGAQSYDQQRKSPVPDDLKILDFHLGMNLAQIDKKNREKFGQGMTGALSMKFGYFQALSKCGIGLHVSGAPKAMISRASQVSGEPLEEFDSEHDQMVSFTEVDQATLSVIGALNLADIAIPACMFGLAPNSPKIFDAVEKLLPVALPSDCRRMKPSASGEQSYCYIGRNLLEFTHFTHEDDRYFVWILDPKRNEKLVKDWAGEAASAAGATAGPEKSQFFPIELVCPATESEGTLDLISQNSNGDKNRLRVIYSNYNPKSFAVAVASLGEMLRDILILDLEAHNNPIDQEYADGLVVKANAIKTNVCEGPASNRQRYLAALAKNKSIFIDASRNR